MSRKPHINEAQVQDIRRLAGEGLDAIEIAQRSGLSITSVWRHAKANRIQIAKRPYVRSGSAPKSVAAPRLGRCPEWVPADLRTEWRDTAKQFGAAYADRAIRKLLEDAA